MNDRGKKYDSIFILFIFPFAKIFLKQNEVGLRFQKSNIYPKNTIWKCMIYTY